MDNPIYSNNRYTHLLPVDIEVWKRFLSSEYNVYSHFDYDVRVGDGRDPGPEFEDPFRKLGIMLSQRRIDAVGHAPDFLAIIEVTRFAGLKSLGQCLAYPILYQVKYNPILPLKSILVCEQLQTDAEIPFREHNITVYEFPPSTSS